VTAAAAAQPKPTTGPRWWRDRRHLPWWRIPLYPTVFPCAMVILIWSHAAVPPSQVVRPLLITFVAMLALTFVLAFLFADRERAGITASAVALFLLSLDDRVGLLLGVVIVALLVEGIVHRGRRAIVAGIATRVLNVVAAILAIAVAIAVAGTGAPQHWFASATKPGLPPIGTAAPGSPDVYVILLDAYPGDRAAALSRTFDRDAFPKALTARGFDVVRDSHSNYLMTQLTLTSMLSMRHLVDIPALDPPYGSREDDWWRVRDVLDDPPAFAEFRAAGYTTTAVDSGFAHVQLPRVDHFVAQPGPGELEAILIWSSRLGKIIDAVVPHARADLARLRIEAPFRETAEIAAQHSASPRLVFTHVPAPHPPWVFDADGSPRNPSVITFADEPQDTDEEALDAGFGQATHVADLTTDLVDKIRASSPTPPVIVVMSDHGPATDFPLAAPLTGAFTVRASNFMAASTPGHQDLIGDRLTPVNLFATLLDAYVGGTRPRQANTIWGWQGSYLNAIEAPPVPGWAP